VMSARPMDQTDAPSTVDQDVPRFRRAAWVANADEAKGITPQMIQAGAAMVNLYCDETHVWSAYVAAKVYKAMRHAAGIDEKPVPEPEGLESERLARKRSD
jgi:hypothetical protein